VYVIETPKILARAPIDLWLVEGWLKRVSTLRVDGVRPSPAELAARLGTFWVRGEQVIYIGLTTGSLSKRLGDYYRTPLGDPRPHAGGHWIRTLRGLNTFRVWWADTEEPARFEAALLGAFADGVADAVAKRMPGGLVLPFANRQTAAGIRKPHGISGSTVPPLAPRRAASTSPLPTTTTPRRTRRSLDEINAALQQLACASTARKVTAVEGARELERLSLLPDRTDRRGLPLRNLLRDGKIGHAHQENGRWWFIRCGQDEP
jgi:hypothetical protein